MHILSGRRDPLVRVRNEDRHKAYAYYLELCGGKDYAHSALYIVRSDGVKWSKQQ